MPVPSQIAALTAAVKLAADLIRTQAEDIQRLTSTVDGLRRMTEDSDCANCGINLLTVGPCPNCEPDA